MNASIPLFIPRHILSFNGTFVCNAFPLNTQIQHAVMFVNKKNPSYKRLSLMPAVKQFCVKQLYVNIYYFCVNCNVKTKVITSLMSFIQPFMTGSSESG